MTNTVARPARSVVLLALVSVYLIWGSTYLAILEAIQTIPPLLMASSRFIVAGLLLMFWLLWRGEPLPSRRAWLAMAPIGLLMLAVGNGAVVWSERTVPSGLAALLVATVSFWTVLLEAVRPGGRRPTAGVWWGLAVGFVGLITLVGPGALSGHAPVKPFGASLLVLGSLAWAIGSLLSVETGKKQLCSPTMATALQMICGSAWLALAGTVRGEWSLLDLTTVSLRSALALFYLMIAGSLIAYTAYQWLLRHSSPAVATTYAYVNPVVAMFLGWLLVDEPFTPRIGIASLLIIGAVALIMRSRTRVASTPAEKLVGVTPRRAAS